MPNYLKRPIGPLGAFLFLSAGLMLASGAGAAPNKVDVCHVPAETPENTKRLSVGGQGGAVADHLSHGDWLVTAPICEDAIADNNCDGLPDGPNAEHYDCVIRTGNPDAICDNQTCIEPAPIARAYIDVDPTDGGFDSTKDVTIAVLLDSDATLGLSVGDTLLFGRYPLSLDPCPDLMTCSALGTFTIPTHTVTAFTLVTPTHIQVTFGCGDVSSTVPCVATFLSPAGVLPEEVFYVEGPPFSNPISCRGIQGTAGCLYRFFDRHHTSSSDSISVTTLGSNPAGADQSVGRAANSSSDDPHVDILINWINGPSY
jgi:hypothetical protein